MNKLCLSLRNSVGWHAPILIDQEGGRVQRVRPPLALDWLPPIDEARKAGQNAESIFKFRFSKYSIFFFNLQKTIPDNLIIHYVS